MKDIPDHSVDFIFSDLPYAITKNKWDKPINLPSLWSGYNRIIKNNGCIALWAQSPFDKTLACSNLKDYRYEWIIRKTKATGFLNAKKMPLKAHENVLIFYRKLPTYNPQKTIGHPRKVSTAAHKANCKQTTNYGTHGLTSYGSTERYPVDVLEFKWDTQTSKLHPTQKPISACEYFIRTYTNPGDLVFDSCMGSGTTAIACVNTGRRFLGCEINEEYFNSAVERVKEVEPDIVFKEIFHRKIT